ncbi:hypothetical protein SCATT_13430 [Streptantibioticus cattleyicolor NRRL 8057 = DSM 46488]|uniref:Uncharacterized protein n=1 Tax=Streptantibioticus cattleyicolor (strain ATCC 35852 / DSM 46488 / JCM 4925 / NBRC 14057 / NRRL 8057) TaxID=1003195 RepID=G8WW58_STREN|nr:hypothetical protein SCATT_13430 [Streptantibioticus cattleyicolor NRRL 8057 = DSM 46488]
MAPFTPARWVVGEVLVWFGTGWVRLLPVRGRGRAGGDSSLQVSATAWLRLLGRCGDTPGTPPCAVVRVPLFAGGVRKEVGVTPIFFSPPPCRSAERNRTGACRGVPAATQRGGGEPTTKRGARSHPGGPPETQEDSAHPALYEHSHGWVGGNSCDASQDETKSGAPRGGNG